MTTNKPEVVGYLVEVTNDPDIGAFFVDHEPALRGCVNTPLVRLSDYEALQAECEKLRALLSQSAPIVHAHAGASHLLEGFRPKRNQWDDLAEAIDAALQEERNP